MQVQHVNVNGSSAMGMAVADMWALSSCQHHVISEWSGFGRIGVARKMGSRLGAVFSLNHKGRVPNGTTCEPSQGLSYKALVSLYPPFL